MESKSSLGHKPSGPWVFDAGVTACFEDMLRRSIPQYEIMRDAVFQIGRRHVQHGTGILDVGCSRGDGLDPFIKLCGAFNRYIGVDSSESMIDAFKGRYAGLINSGLVKAHLMDLNDRYPADIVSLTLAVLTLQFMPWPVRRTSLEFAFHNTTPGGALILVEKVIPDGASLAGHYTDIYHNFKMSNGYSQGEVDAKAKSLRGVLVPATVGENVAMLKSAGFKRVEVFWQWFSFCGIVAVK